MGDTKASRISERSMGLALVQVHLGRDNGCLMSKTELDALLIQNSRESWVAFPRTELTALRVKHL